MDEYSEIIRQLHEYNEILLNTYISYRNAIERIEDLLEQVQDINPNFDLPLPDIYPVTVSALGWYIMSMISPGFLYDSSLFRFLPFTLETGLEVYYLAGGGPDLLDNMQLTYFFLGEVWAAQYYIFLQATILMLQ